MSTISSRIAADAMSASQDKEEELHLDDVVLGHERALRESIESERRDIDARRLAADDLRDHLARRRRVYQAMAGKAGRADESWHLVDGAEDRVLVRRVLVEARPTGLHGRTLQDR